MHETDRNGREIRRFATFPRGDAPMKVRVTRPVRATYQGGRYGSVYFRPKRQASHAVLGEKSEVVAAKEEGPSGEG